MRHGTSSRRQRNRGNGGRRGNQQRAQVYDSNGPDVRIRGTAHQVAEKYAALAKDAAAADDTILAQSYLQHAEHYQRIINEMQSGVQSGRNGQRQQKKEQKREAPPAKTEDDLSLPASILGESPKKEVQAESEERTDELSTT